MNRYHPKTAVSKTETSAADFMHQNHCKGLVALFMVLLADKETGRGKRKGETGPGKERGERRDAITSTAEVFR